MFPLLKHCYNFLQIYVIVIVIYLNKRKFNESINKVLFLKIINFGYYRQLDIFNIIKEIVFCRPCIDIMQELIHLFSKISIYTEITDNLCQLSCKLNINNIIY